MTDSLTHDEILNSKLIGAIDQYKLIKKAHENKIILFQIGAFYEVFGEDSLICSKILGIKQTSKKYKNDLIPMCGFSTKVKNEYIKKLLSSGKSIVLIEEKKKTEIDAEKTNIKRFVSDILTPSTCHINQNYSYSNENSYIASIFPFGKNIVILFFDISTSEAFFEYTKYHQDSILKKLAIYNCKEVVYSDNLSFDINFFHLTSTKIEKNHIIYDYEAEESMINGFNNLLTEEKHAFYIIFEYLKRLNKSFEFSITEIIKRYDGNKIYMPLSAISSLNIIDLNNSNQENEFSLFGILNNTKTELGSRFLKAMLVYPINIEIELRHKIIEYFLQNEEFLLNITSSISGINCDIERSFFRILNQSENIDMINLFFENLKSICEININFIDQNIYNIPSKIKLANSNVKKYFLFNSLSDLDAVKNKKLIIKIAAACVKDFAKDILIIAKFFGFLDAISSCAFLFKKLDWKKPEIDYRNKIEIKESYHAILHAKKFFKVNHKLVANDFSVSGDGIKRLVITGANMSGKSLYLRQIGICVLLSQIGFYVPCEYMKIGKVDAILTRIGYGDDLSLGKSTFYIEMEDIAEMTHTSSSRSLCLIDEIGRGTSFEEGLEISKRILKYLKNFNNAYIVCTTHVHELAEFAEQNLGFCNKHLEAFEQDGDLFFTHKVKNGISKKSFVKNVAKQVNMPKDFFD